MRTFELTHDKLLKILTDRTEVHKEITKLNDEMIALDKKRNKLSYKMQALKDKTVPIVEEITPKLSLGEFEIITQIGINKYGRPEFQIVDELEEQTRPKTGEEIEEIKKAIKARKESVK
jgi:predicted  nucleic acid-binding Zn-ribbon protein